MKTLGTTMKIFVISVCLAGLMGTIGFGAYATSKLATPGMTDKTPITAETAEVNTEANASHT